MVLVTSVPAETNGKTGVSRPLTGLWRRKAQCQQRRRIKLRDRAMPSYFGTRVNGTLAVVSVGMVRSESEMVPWHCSRANVTGHNLQMSPTTTAYYAQDPLAVVATPTHSCDFNL